MNKFSIEYINYNPFLHGNFPVIQSCNICEKNGVINVMIKTNLIVNNIDDDIGYDNDGRYLSVTIGQWHHIETGQYISVEEFYDLPELEVYEYDYVSVVIKIRATGEYKPCYHNYLDKNIKLSFIPMEIMNFSHLSPSTISYINQNG